MSAKKPVKNPASSKRAAKKVTKKAVKNSDPGLSDKDKAIGTQAPKAAGNSPGSQENESDPNFDASRYHLKIVELATQLACAQLSAEAAAESARLTVSGIQRIAAAYVMASARIKMDLETLSTNPDLIDAAFVDRAYAQLLSAAEVQELSLHKAPPLNHPQHDDLFEGAMIRAQRMLRSPSEDTTLVHAEQIFGAEETLTETQVGKRFNEFEWPVLRNRDDYYKFIVSVEKWFHDHLYRLYSPEEDEQSSVDARILGQVLDIGLRRKGNDFFRQIYEFVRNQRPPNRRRDYWSDVEEMAQELWTKHLISVIFCKRQPSIRIEDNRRINRSYYPWGLFRFLRIYGAEDAVGSELLARLAVPRKDIKHNAIVYPLRQNFPDTCDFGPLERLAEESQSRESSSI
jgi:hypothetical protein